jgi:hypothetical protein
MVSTTFGCSLKPVNPSRENAFQSFDEKGMQDFMYQSASDRSSPIPNKQKSRSARSEVRRGIRHVPHRVVGWALEGGIAGVNTQSFPMPGPASGQEPLVKRTKRICHEVFHVQFGSITQNWRINVIKRESSLPPHRSRIQNQTFLMAEALSLKRACSFARISSTPSRSFIRNLMIILCSNSIQTHV